MIDRDLALLLKRAIAEFRTFLHAQREQIDAIAEEAKTQKKASEIQPASEPERVRNEVNFPPETVKRYYSEQAKSYRLQRGAFWVGLVTLIALAVYTVYTIKMYHANRDAAYAAKSAAETAADTLNRSIEQFRIDERAWIEIDRIERSRIGPAFRYRLYPQNVGKTAAHGVVVNAARSMQTSISLEGNADGIKRTQDGILLNALPPEARENPIPKVIAPNTTAIVPFVMDGQAPQIFAKDERVSYLIGRIDYADAFGIKHWMKFCFYVGEANGNLWNCHEGNEEDQNAEFEPSKKR